MSDSHFSPQPWHVRLGINFSDTVERRDRTYRLVANAPRLYEIARAYAAACAECGGVGVLQLASTLYPDARVGEICPACEDIRAVLNEIEGPLANGNPRGWVEVKR